MKTQDDYWREGTPLKLRLYTCVECGCDFIPNSANHLHCPTCKAGKLARNQVYTCTNCGDEFVPIQFKQQLCSRCKRGIPLKKRIYSCLECEGEFKPKCAGQKFCKVKCRESNYNRESYIRGRFLIFQRDEFRCVYCGASSIEDGILLHLEHIYPQVLGGKDTASNLVTACDRCNLQKQDKVLDSGVASRLKVLVDKRNKKASIVPEMQVKLM